MVIIKIVIIALICAIMTLYLKKYAPDIAVLVSIAGGIMIIFLTVDQIFGLTEQLNEFFAASQVDSDLLKIIIKVTILAYIVEFAAGAVRDLGENSLAEKVLLSGKIAILALSFPIITSLIGLIAEVING